VKDTECRGRGMWRTRNMENAERGGQDRTRSTRKKIGGG
jgi:hypothetical protein